MTMSGDSTVCLVVCLGDVDEWGQYCMSSCMFRGCRWVGTVLFVASTSTTWPRTTLDPSSVSSTRKLVHFYFIIFCFRLSAPIYIFLVKKNVQSVFLDICFSRKICLVKLILSKISLSMCQFIIVKTRREQKKTLKIIWTEKCSANQNSIFIVKT